MSDKPISAADALLEEAKKKVASVAEEYFNAMLAERLSQLADGAAASLIPEAARAEAETEVRAEATAAAEAELAEEVAAAEAAVEAAAEAAAADAPVEAAEAVDEAEEPVIIIDEEPEEEAAPAPAPAPAAAPAADEDDAEPHCIHFEDEDDQFDADGNRIPYIPYND